MKNINWTKFIKSLLIFLVIGLIFFFLFKRLHESWDQLADYKFTFSPTLMTFSFFFYISMHIFFGLLWNQVLKKLDPSSNMRSFRAVTINIYSFFARYVPGKIGLILGKAYLAKEEGIGYKNSITSSLYENIFIINAGLSLGLLGVSSYLYTQGHSLYIYLSGTFIIISNIVLFSKGFYYPLKLALKIFKRDPLPKEYFLPTKDIIWLSILYLIPCLIEGFGYYLVVSSITSLNPGSVLYLIGVINLAGSIGIIALFAPSGLGVREGIMVLLLQAVMPLEVAILTSILARLWTVIGDLVTLVITFIFNRIPWKSSIQDFATTK